MTLTTPHTGAQVHQQQSTRRQARGWWLLWAMIGTFVALVLGVPGGVYLAWLQGAKADLDREIAAIVAAREPLTTTELTAYYALPPGERNLTADWQAALAPLAAAAQQLTHHDLPPLGQSLPNEQGLRDSLAKMQPQIDLLHTLADQPGEVRYPHDFAGGASMLMPEIDALQGARHMLELEFQIAARQGDTARVLRNLQTRVRMADTLASEPIAVALLMRASLHRTALRDIQHYANLQPDLADADLAALQALARDIDYQPQLRTVLLGERALAYQAHHYRFRNEDELVSAAASGPRVTTHDASGVVNPECCAITLRQYSELIAAAKLPTAQQLDAVDSLHQDFELLGDTPFSVWRYGRALVWKQIPQSVAYLAKATTYRDLTDVALAMHRYRQANGDFPADLNDLVPNFLPTLPVDPCDGRPLRMKLEPTTLTLYSVGIDRIDDGGQCEVDSLAPDVSAVIPKQP